jgi:hypothetical protein
MPRRETFAVIISLVISTNASQLALGLVSRPKTIDSILSGRPCFFIDSRTAAAIARHSPCVGALIKQYFRVQTCPARQTLPQSAVLQLWE